MLNNCLQYMINVFGKQLDIKSSHFTSGLYLLWQVLLCDN